MSDASALSSVDDRSTTGSSNPCSSDFFDDLKIHQPREYLEFLNIPQSPESLLPAFSDAKHAFRLCATTGVLSRGITCPRCHKSASVVCVRRERSEFNSAQFVCMACTISSNRWSVVDCWQKTFFEGINLGIEEALYLIFCLLSDTIDHSAIIYEKSMRRSDRHHSFAYREEAYKLMTKCREMCLEKLTTEGDNLIGAKGRTVEITEATFLDGKYIQGKCAGGVWIVIGFCYETKEFFVCLPDEVNEKELDDVIRCHVRPWATIVTDYECWIGEGDEEMPLRRLACNYFVEGVSMARIVKWRNSLEFNNFMPDPDPLILHFAFYIWTMKYGQGNIAGKFIQFLRHVGELFSRNNDVEEIFTVAESSSTESICHQNVGSGRQREIQQGQCPSLKNCCWSKCASLNSSGESDQCGNGNSEECKGDLNSLFFVTGGEDSTSEGSTSPELRGTGNSTSPAFSSVGYFANLQRRGEREAESGSFDIIRTDGTVTTQYTNVKGAITMGPAIRGQCVNYEQFSRPEADMVVNQKISGEEVFYPIRSTLSSKEWEAVRQIIRRNNEGIINNMEAKLQVGCVIVTACERRNLANVSVFCENENSVAADSDTRNGLGPGNSQSSADKNFVLTRRSVEPDDQLKTGEVEEGTESLARSEGNGLVGSSAVIDVLVDADNNDAVEHCCCFRSKRMKMA